MSINGGLGGAEEFLSPALQHESVAGRNGARFGGNRDGEAGFLEDMKGYGGF